METLVAASSCRLATIAIASERPTQFVDLTDQLEAFVADSGIRLGLLNVQTLHTTTAVVVNEHEPLLLADFAMLLEALAPSHTCYRHDDVTVRTVNLTLGERANGHAHCRALLLPPSACLNVVGGRLQLGQWQRVFFVDLDGPRPRQVSVVLFGNSEPAPSRFARPCARPADSGTRLECRR
jgi:secondary thiamine-phosphate synthase enzyme